MLAHFALNVALVLVQAAVVAVPVLGLYGLWRFLRAYERRGQEPLPTDGILSRIAQLEDAIADLSASQERLGAEQQFVTHLLAGRKEGSAHHVP